MKRLILLLSSFVISACLWAQKSPVSTTELAEQIQGSYSRPADEIRAAYTWVANNIRYSTEGILAMNHGLDRRAVIDVSFTKRRGVCENFAAIFADICQKMGFRSVVIEGYTTLNLHEDRDGHSWAAVYIDDAWYLFDPTWDMGKTVNFNYFMKSGMEFISTHVPFDPMWQMLKHPIGENIHNHSATFNYKDSIDAYLSSDSLNRYESATARIQNKKLKNKLTDTHLKVLQNELEIHRQEEQMQWYNAAVNYMNQATDALNNFIDLRNNGFKEINSMDTLKKLLSEVGRKLDSVSVNLNRVDKSKATLVYGTEPAREQLEKIRKKYREQQLFLMYYTEEKISKN